jgi:hypothetical protein
VHSSAFFCCRPLLLLLLLCQHTGFPGQPRQQEGTNVLANLLGGYGENE